MISGRDHIALNLWGLAVGVLFWPFHVISLWASLAIMLVPVLPWMAWKIHRDARARAETDLRSGSSDGRAPAPQPPQASQATEGPHTQEVAAKASQEGTPGERRFGSSPAPSADIDDA